jgi:hypothetical protein
VVVVLVLVPRVLQLRTLVPQLLAVLLPGAVLWPLLAQPVPLLKMFVAGRAALLVLALRASA